MADVRKLGFTPLTTPTNSSLNASRFVLSLSLKEKATKVFLASYLRL